MLRPFTRIPRVRKEEMTTSLHLGMVCARGSPVGLGKEAASDLAFQKNLSL